MKKNRIFYTSKPAVFVFFSYLLMLACLMILIFAIRQYFVISLAFTIYMAVNGYFDVKKWEKL